MSNNNDDLAQTTEEKFLGVRNMVASPDADAPEVQVEVVDDRPLEDQRHARKGPAAETDVDADDESELSQYSDRAQKRIKKLKFEYHEQRREAEAKAREAAEAVRFAQRMKNRAEQLEKVLHEGGKVLTEQATNSAKAQATMAQQKLAKAHEAGDAAAIAEATAELSAATLSTYTAPNLAARLAASVPDEDPVQMAPQVPTPDARAQQWAKKNPWFGKDPEKTSLAYGIHQKLVNDGVDTTSDEYYKRLDKRMREVFPDLAADEADEVTTAVETHVTRTATQQRPTQVVAPVTRGNGSAPRKVQLTATQVSLAKRLGLTPEQYAKQLLKENNNGR